MIAPAPSPEPRGAALLRFLNSSAGGGVLLMVAALLAILMANSPLGGAYHDLIHMRTGPVLTDKLGPMTVHLWINDGLMAVFFLLVGLEIKRECLDGRLSTWEQRRLPLLPAFMGMAVPAVIYLIVTGDPAYAHGWAIPSATDIAFAVAVLALLGRRAPLSLKLFLVTVAIVDDMGAVVIIALFYTAQINIVALAAAALVLAVMMAMNRMRILLLWPYVLGIGLLWYALLLSGVHATIAGVLGAMAVPIIRTPNTPDAAHSPLHRLEHAIAPWVGLLIVPIFGFANAGVDLRGLGVSELFAPLPLGVAAGLFFGKQIGVFSGVLIAAKTGLAVKPRGATWLQIYGVAMLCGIGFTMSLFISGLAFPGHPEMAEATKLGILGGSLVSAAAGCLILRFAPRAPDWMDEEAKQRTEILVDGDVKRM